MKNDRYFPLEICFGAGRQFERHDVSDRGSATCRDLCVVAVSVCKE